MLTLKIVDEFAELRSVLVHGLCDIPGLNADEYRENFSPEELEKRPSVAHSMEVACEEHERLFRLFERFGVTLERPVPLEHGYYQIFTRDPAFVVGDTLYLASLDSKRRKPEPDGLRDLQARGAKTIDLRGDGVFIDGGDVIVLKDGGLTLVGRHRRTNDAGIDRLTAHLAPAGVEVVRVPHRVLHLDCCLGPLPNGDALLVASRLPPESLDAIQPLFGRLHPLDEQEGVEHLAANVFWLNPETAVSSEEVPKTNALLRSFGYDVHTVNVSDMVAMGGSVRCLTCPLQRG